MSNSTKNLWKEACESAILALTGNMTVMIEKVMDGSSWVMCLSYSSALIAKYQR